MKTYVFYHANCPDGMLSAAILYDAFGGYCVLEGVSYNDYEKTVDSVIRGLDSATGIIFVDFCPSVDYLKKFYDEYRMMVTVLDHHPPCAKVKEVFRCDENVNVVYNPDRAGCGIALEWVNEDRIFPRLKAWASYVEDFDLWKFELEETRYVSAYINTHIKSPHYFARHSVEQAIEHGEFMYRYKESLIERIAVNGAMQITIGGHSVIACECPPELSSEVCDYIYRALGYKMGVAFHFHDKDTIKLSLRSGGSVNVRQIAEKFCGGGHDNAAGCYVSKEQFFQMIGG